MTKDLGNLILLRFHQAAPPFETDGMLGCKEFDIFKAGYLAAIEDAKISPCPKPECQELYDELVDKRRQVRDLQKLATKAVCEDLSNIRTLTSNSLNLSPVLPEELEGLPVDEPELSQLNKDIITVQKDFEDSPYHHFEEYFDDHRLHWKQELGAERYSDLYDHYTYKRMIW